MTEPTRLTNAQRQRTWRILSKIPYHLQIPGAGAGSIVTVEALLAYLDRALPYIAKEVEQLHQRTRDNARAAVVLAGLRSDLERAASTLAELDALENDGGSGPTEGEARTLLDHPVDDDREIVIVRHARGDGAAALCGDLLDDVETIARVYRHQTVRPGEANVDCPECLTILQHGDAVLRDIVGRRPEIARHPERPLE